MTFLVASPKRKTGVNFVCKIKLCYLECWKVQVNIHNLCSCPINSCFSADNPAATWTMETDSNNQVIAFPSLFSILSFLKGISRKWVGIFEVKSWDQRFENNLQTKIFQTRMHSIRTHTAHSLPYGGCLPDRDPPGQKPHCTEPPPLPPRTENPPGQRPPPRTETP